MFLEVHTNITQNPKASPIVKGKAAMDLAHVSNTLDGEEDENHDEDDDN